MVGNQRVMDIVTERYLVTNGAVGPRKWLSRKRLQAKKDFRRFIGGSSLNILY
jgi:hypothetical protein